MSILLGDGIGGFSAATNFDAGSAPTSVAVGDFNDYDTKQDLAVANFDSNDVSILLGLGAGDFAPTINFSAGSSPTSVAVGDFNGDGKQDLVVANYNSNDVSILFGDGAGNFSAATNFGVVSYPNWLAVGDFNGDAKQDLVVAHGADNVSILLRDCAPTPTPTPTPTATVSPTPTPTPTPAYAAQIQQPINADGTSVFNVRRGVVPVKFTLTLNGVATCNLPPATIAVYRTGTGGNQQIEESVYTGSADTGSNFRISSCQYVYNLSASALGVGTYRVDIIINGQVVGSATFALR